MKGTWSHDSRPYSPMEALTKAHSREYAIQGLVPMRGITWVYGPSMSFKSFIAMSMAHAMATGTDWMGMKTAASEVIYLAAEGGDGLPIRRAAVEFHKQHRARFLTLVQDRPQLDTVDGGFYLRGILDEMFALYSWNGELEDPHPAYVKAKDLWSDERRGKYIDGDDWESARVEDANAHYVVIIDTYSQTSGGDEKHNVTAFVKTLRDIIEEAKREAREDLSFIVIDHATKAGGSFLGSVAKLNDVDSQIEVARDGSSMRAKLIHRKSKDARACNPIALELVPYVFEDYEDAYGDPLASLVVEDGVRAADIADVADHNPGVLLTMIMDAGGHGRERDFRKEFYALPSYVGGKPQTAMKAFKRAKDKLLEMGTIEDCNGELRVSML